MKKSIATTLLTVMTLGASFAQKSLNLSTNTNKEIIAALTLEEKARLLVGMGMTIPGMMSAQIQAASLNHKVATVSSKPTTSNSTAPASATSQGVGMGNTQDGVAGAAGTTAAFEVLGIPSMVVADGPAGLRISPTRGKETRTYYATAFPIATLLASSWNTDLIQKTGEAMGNEVKEYGIDFILGPAMNIHRNALGGRNFEYYSEDPLLTGKAASAMVKGIQSNGVGTSVKHFAVNNHETNRNTTDAKVSERALREIYLRGFEIAVKESKPWSVMSSYNKINGTYASESGDLLKKILCQDWGYKGFVMTDWFGGTNAVEQMKAGNALLMPGTPNQMKEIIEAVKKGQLEEKDLDENVDKMLNVIKETPAFKAYKASNTPDLKAHAMVARQSATEGMILLKNDKQALPMTKGQTIAAFGNYTYNLISGGTGSGDVNEAYTVSLTEGLVNAGFSLNKTVQKAYDDYLKVEIGKQPKNRPFFLPTPVIPEMPMTKENIAAATTDNIAVVTIGRVSGEFFDRKKDNDYYLTDAEKELIKNVSDAFHAKGKKVVVVLNVGGVIETASWRGMVDAILLTWQPGQEAGNAIADIMSGKDNPSGKLATTFTAKYEDDPTSNGFPGKEYGDVIPLLGGMIKAHAMESNYSEGIYVGYRGFDKQNITPAFEFGYGLSYTDFTYSNLKLSSSNFKDKITVTVTVKNTGKVAGKEVAQLYLTAPNKTMDKPTQELKGFAKTKLLAPNESQTLTFDLDARALCSFDETTETWVAESGTYTVKMAASSRNIKLKADFKLAKTLMVEKVNKALPMK